MIADDSNGPGANGVHAEWGISAPKMRSDAFDGEEIISCSVRGPCRAMQGRQPGRRPAQCRLPEGRARCV